MSCVRIMFWALLIWLMNTPLWAQRQEPWNDPAKMSRQIDKLSRGHFDDKAVSFWRAIIVESAKPLFKHGEQMTEQDLVNHLSRWARDDSVIVALDSGFMLPVLPRLHKVIMEESSDSKLAPDKKSLLDVGIGTAIRIKSEDHPSGLHMEAQIELYGMKGLSLRDSFVNRLKWGAVATDVTKHVSIGLTWDTAFTTVTALTGALEGARYPCCTVLLLPVSKRPALRAATDVLPPIAYSKGSVRIISGSVRSTTFWAMMKDVRPDIPGPALNAPLDVLDLSWSNEKWHIFKRATEKLGTVWRERTLQTLMPEAGVSAKHGSLEVSFQWRPQNRMLWDVTGRMNRKGDMQITTEYRNHVFFRSESFQQRWNFVVCTNGMITDIIAVRFDFE